MYTCIPHTWCIAHVYTRDGHPSGDRSLGGVRGFQAASAAHVQAHSGRFPSKHKPGSQHKKNKKKNSSGEPPKSHHGSPLHEHTHTNTSCRAFPALGPLTPPELQSIYIYIHIYDYKCKQTAELCRTRGRVLNNYIYIVTYTCIRPAHLIYVYMKENQTIYIIERARGSCAVTPPSCTR